MLRSHVVGVVGNLREGAAGAISAPGNLGQAAIATLQGDRERARAEWNQFTADTGRAVDGLRSIPLVELSGVAIAGVQVVQGTMEHGDLRAGLREGVEALPYYNTYLQAEQIAMLARPELGNAMRDAREAGLGFIYTPVPAAEIAPPAQTPSFGILRERENGARTPQ